jgi:proline iminopeptidase
MCLIDDPIINQAHMRAAIRHGHNAAMGYELTDPSLVDTLDVGDGHRVAWSQAGNPAGKPVVLLLGGPGSGSSPSHRHLFNPATYRIIQFDQRNSGKSLPYAGDVHVDLSANTTQHLISDIERLRFHVGIDRWLVWGGSWGTTLGLAYAEAHPESVSGLILAAVVSTSSRDVEWVTRTVGRLFPRQWQAFRDHLPPDRRDGNLAQAYNELLMNPDPAVHVPAARAWCRWEDTHVSLIPSHTPNPRYEDPAFRLSFARIVTHYWANAAFLDDDELINNADRLAGIPVYLAHGRLDVSSPIDFPMQLAEALPTAELFIADSDGHSGDSITQWTTSITDALADQHRA